ncbi:MAG TPA: ferritin-like domain-containing protein [Actinomycetota bacterium]|nr:ferritin-like domain-containing protein [Actinomycetota bacterium]
MEMESLKELFVHELRDAYSAEQQLTEALPKMAKEASGELKQAFETHLEETKGQIARLEQIFETLEEKPTYGNMVCKGMKGLVQEAEDLLSEDGDKTTLEAGMIAAAQKVEHYEIATYGTLRTYAEQLGQTEAARLLEETLEEEKKTDELLTQLAVGSINVEAASQA